MKKTIALLLAIIMVFTFCAACSENDSSSETEVIEDVGEGTTQIANPITYLTIDQIEEIEGIDISLPSGISLTYIMAITATDNSLYSIEFILDENDYNFRFQKTDEYEDISGMYYEFSYVETDEYTLATAETGEGLLNWYKDGYSLSISTSRCERPEVLVSLYKLLNENFIVG